MYQVLVFIRDKYIKQYYCIAASLDSITSSIDSSIYGFILANYTLLKIL